ncbi:MAG: hypothetical protein ACW99L_07555, partial [Promethearchaeota archaeon]
MKDKKLKSFFNILILVFLTLPVYSSKSKADIVGVYYTGAGDFFPAENCSLSMTNASVILSIEYPRLGEVYEKSLGLNRAYLDFQGNYSIFNPGDSLNMTIVAPFSTDFKQLESTFEIKVEEFTIPFTVVEYEYPNPWEEYFNAPWGVRKFIMTNVTF